MATSKATTAELQKTEPARKMAHPVEDFLLGMLLGAVVLGIVLGPLLWYYGYYLPKKRKMMMMTASDAIIQNAQLAGATATTATPPPANTDAGCSAACKGQAGVAGWTRDTTSGACSCWTPSASQTVWMSPTAGYNSGFYSSST
jgi:hypothetical protein